MPTEDALTSLLVTDEEVLRAELAECLTAFVRLTDTGRLVLAAAFESLDAIRKVACVLLAYRAAYLLDLRASPAATPKEIVLATGMAGGTVRPKLATLAKRRLATANAGAYQVPSPYVRALTRLVSGAGDG